MKLVYSLFTRAIALSLLAAVSAHAQSADPGRTQTDSTVTREQPDALWDPVTRLTPGTLLNVSAKMGGGHCVLQSVSDSGLVCRRRSSSRDVRREDISRIRLSRRGRSTGVGFAIGASVGAGAGAGIGSVVNNSDKGSLLHVSGGKSAGVGAGVGVIVGGAAGALIGYSDELIGGPVIYRR